MRERASRQGRMDDPRTAAGVPRSGTGADKATPKPIASLPDAGFGPSIALPGTPVNDAPTWLLSGIPRSGSTLCCRLADGLPDIVALSEPIGRDLSATAASADEACALIEDFAARTRARALREGVVPTAHVGGRLDDLVAHAASASGRREPRAERGDIAVGANLTPAFRLVIKHNALFAALLAGLSRSFPCAALVRNPVAVLASWQTVALPVGRGRIPAGEQFDAALRADLDREPDVLKRQVRILNWFFRQYRMHVPTPRIVRYEELVATGGTALYRVLGRDGAAPAPLVSRNDNAAYDAVSGERLVATLLDAGGAWEDFYAAADCAAAADAIGTAHAAA